MPERGCFLASCCQVEVNCTTTKCNLTVNEAGCFIGFCSGGFMIGCFKRGTSATLSHGDAVIQTAKATKTCQCKMCKSYDRGQLGSAVGCGICHSVQCIVECKVRLVGSV